MPPRIFIRVDLPAPFSPIRAWTSPRRIVRLTSRRTGTPPNSFVMPVMVTASGMMVSDWEGGTETGPGLLIAQGDATSLGQDDTYVCFPLLPLTMQGFAVYRRSL